MKNANTVGLINGSMAVAKRSGKVKNVTRKRIFMAPVAEMVSSSQVLSAVESPYPVGSAYSTGTMLFSISELSEQARKWIQQFDKYRILSIEVFVTLVSRSKNGSIDRTAPVELYFYEDTDADPDTTTNWVRTCCRDNLGRVVLNATYPSMQLLSFKPTATFKASQIDQNPANMIPDKNAWFEALHLNQLFSGVRWFSCCPQVDTQGQSYEYSLGFQQRVTVEVSQPI